MKKKSSLVIAFLLGIIFILFYKLGTFGVIYNEASYKMNGVEPRFVKTFRYTPIHKVETLNTNDNGNESQIYFEKLTSIIPQIENILSPLDINENIYFFIQDLANTGFTANIVNGKIILSPGIDENVVPSIVFTIDKEDIDGIEFFLQDGILELSEKLKMADVLMLGIIENLYRQEKFYKSSNMSIFKFDDFMHFEIKNNEQILRGGKLVDLRVSIFNIDGQWIVKKGFVGDPDITMSIDIDDALKFYKLISIDLKETMTKKEAVEVSKEAFDILIPNINYTRKDHE